MDKGAWRATVHGVAKSQTQLSDSHTHTHTHTHTHIHTKSYYLILILVVGGCAARQGPFNVMGKGG